MNLRLGVFILTVLVCGVTASAETVELPLNRVLGDYPATVAWPDEGCVRCDTVTYTGLEVGVLEVSLALSGDAEFGLLACCTVPVGSDTLVWGMAGAGRIKRIGDPGDIWENYWRGGATLEDDGPFDITIGFVCYGGFSTLAPGDRIAVCQGFAPWGYVAGCVPIGAPRGYVSGATLVIEVHDVVPVENPTWGRMKALFNN